MKLPVVVLAFVPFLLAPIPAAATTLEELKAEWLEEATRLERWQDHYGRAAEAQEASFDELDAARRAVDGALASPEVSIEELRRLEARLTRARDEALDLAEEAADIRDEIYGILESLAELGDRVERARAGDLPAGPGVGGLWRAEWDSSGDFGIVRLETKGHLVTGTYRLTNGNAGTLKGTSTGDRIRLDVIDSVDGLVGDVDLRLDGRQARGQWRRREVGGPRRATGAVSMRLLDESDAAETLGAMP